MNEVRRDIDANYKQEIKESGQGAAKAASGYGHGRDDGRHGRHGRHGRWRCVGGGMEWRRMRGSQ